MLMKISERRFGDAVVLDLVGPLAGAKAVALIDSAVRRHSRSGRPVVVANLGRVPLVDLAGLGALVEAYRMMREAGGVLRLAAITKRIHDLVVITRLLTVFDTFDSVEEAVGVRVPAPAGLAETAQLSMMSLGRIRRFLDRA
jgi:anti-sigma B factor antagonist